MIGVILFMVSISNFFSFEAYYDYLNRSDIYQQLPHTYIDIDANCKNMIKKYLNRLHNNIPIEINLTLGFDMCKSEEAQFIEQNISSKEVKLKLSGTEHYLEQTSLVQYANIIAIHSYVGTDEEFTEKWLRKYPSIKFEIFLEDNYWHGNRNRFAEFARSFYNAGNENPGFMENSVVELKLKAIEVTRRPSEDDIAEKFPLLLILKV
jgi:hypothetical protein